MSLWDNPQVEAARKAMTPEQLRQHEQMGEYMYGNMDQINNAALFDGPKLEEAAEYLSEAIKSGLHPSMLEENDKAVLKEIQGDKWWEKYGFVEGDLSEIITLIKNK
jgi:hypothetical protein